MFESLKRHLTPAVLALTLSQTFAPCFAADLPFRLSRIFPHAVDDVGTKPITNKDGCIEELARNIDWLEHHLNMNGTVVAKIPDVWGEARLTAHRQEFEEVLRAELWNFQKNQVNGAEFVKDSAMLAFALQLTATGGTATPPATPTLPTASSMSPSNPFGAASPTQMTASSFAGSNAIQVEQTEMLDQLANYVRHLHALRRNNEGPDSSDAPGYSMNLLRIPVSLLPGQNTKRGYGAEITITADPYLGDELLPTAFRDFVVNDLIDQLALPFAQYLNGDPAVVRVISAAINGFQASATRIRPSEDPKFNTPGLVYLSDDDRISQYRQQNPDTNHPDWTIVQTSSGVYYKFFDAAFREQSNRVQSALDDAQRSKDPVIKQLREINATMKNAGTPDLQFKAWWKLMSTARAHIEDGLSHSTSSATRRTTLPFPPSQLVYNFGEEYLANVVSSMYATFQQDLVNRQVVHVSDLHAVLREEIGAAYELLARQSALDLWNADASYPPEQRIVELVRTRNHDELVKRRDSFDNFLWSIGYGEVTCALAWCVYVDSLLLSDRMDRDIQRTYGNTPNSPMYQPGLDYHMPNPSPQARTAFAQYVGKRWPIHVFALDPDINEQNIQDVRSIYRQMQLAVAMGYAQGNLGIGCALQAMRQLQRDRATVDLNRIGIGFGHGENTFGWRFAPRFETPAITGNATTFFRNLFVGGPTDQEVQDGQQIEPGARECSAIIIMPSFVPHITLRTRGNWFKLTCPTRTGDSAHDTVHYSRAVKTMEYNAQMCCQCAHLYRDGEVERLLARVKQIDQKLAMQTLECPVPIENTNGGHEILTAGRKELAPELHGWYGAPGYDPVKGTTLFLSGEAFSVTQSKLIVGNQPIDYRLLSRQVMQVQLPPGLSVMRDRKLDDVHSEQYSGYIDAQLATPYGISGHMLIPVIRIGTAEIIPPAVTPLTLNVIAYITQTGTPVDPTQNVVAKFSSPPLDAQLRVELPTNSLGSELTGISAVLFTNKSQQRLLNVGAIPLIRAFEEATYESLPDAFSSQFPASTPASGSLGYVIKQHIEYQFQQGKLTGLNSPVIYELGVGVTANSAAAQTSPVIKATGTIKINVKLVAAPPPPAAPNPAAATPAAAATTPAATTAAATTPAATTTPAAKTPPAAGTGGASTSTSTSGVLVSGSVSGQVSASGQASGSGTVP